MLLSLNIIYLSEMLFNNRADIFGDKILGQRGEMIYNSENFEDVLASL